MSRPHRLAPIEQIFEAVKGGGCEGWVPSDGGRVHGDFTVVGDELVDGAECQGEPGEASEPETAITSEPLFARNIDGGRWRVLRWLTGSAPPSLAAEGNLLAAGVVESDTETTRSGTRASNPEMRTSVIDLPSGRVVSHFEAPDGYLSFASARRLLVSELLPEPARAGARAPAPSAQTPIAPLRQTVYRNLLYSLRGHRDADLGTSSELLLVSDMHVLEDETSNGHLVLAVRALSGGAERRLVGFDAPVRQLLDIAFRWPAVAIIETTSAPLAQDEVTCTSGDYRAASAPFLSILDLARHEPFLPAPAPSAARRPAGCPAERVEPFASELKSSRR